MSYLMDLHIYTNNTPGTRDKISFLCETAVEKQFRAVAFADPADVSAAMSFDLKRKVLHSFFDMSKARQLFFDSLRVFAGVELRQAYLAPEAAAHIAGAQPYDIVLTGVTCFAGGRPFGLSPDMPQTAFDGFAREYADVLLQTALNTDFDVLAHPLLPLRGMRADFALFEAKMDRVLAALAERGKALQISTRDILGSERVRDLYLRLAKRFLALGGVYVTVGSECCSHDELGAGVELAMSALKRAGFSAVTFYDQRTPYLTDL